MTDTTGLIYGKLIEAARLMEGVEKGGYNSAQKFKFRGIEQLTQACAPIFKEVGIVVVPIMSTVRDVAQPDKGYRAVIEATYRFYAEDGSCVEATTIGEGVDSYDKPLALDTPIPTTTGWTTMERVSVGDQLVDMDGIPTRVVRVGEITEQESYRLTFRGGDSIIASHNHDWFSNHRGSLRIRSTADLFGRKQRGQIVTLPGSPVWHLPERPLPIDPWVLGYWLGNGAAAEPKVTCGAKDQSHVDGMIQSAGYELGHLSTGESGATTRYIKGVRKQFADLGLLGAKHIPSAYMRASKAQRLALLRGLMDSDGCGQPNGALFVSTDPHLRDQVAELARSLGESVTSYSQPAHGFGVHTTAHRCVWLPATTPFALPRKSEKLLPRQRGTFHAVSAIEPVGLHPVRCIAVDSPSSSYLVGERQVPTHNSTNKAMSAAFKYALLQTLCIGDPDDDGDSHSEPKPARKAAKPAANNEVSATDWAAWETKRAQLLADDSLKAQFAEWVGGQDFKPERSISAVNFEKLTGMADLLLSADGAPFE